MLWDNRDKPPVVLPTFVVEQLPGWRGLPQHSLFWRLCGVVRKNNLGDYHFAQRRLIRLTAKIRREDVFATPQ